MGRDVPTPSTDPTSPPSGTGQLGTGHLRTGVERDLRRRARQLMHAHDHFLATGEADRPVRPLVLDSWRRSLDAGVQTEAHGATVRLDADTLERLRAEHPLAVAMPLIRNLLVQSAADAGLLVAVSDAAGQLLWVEGDDRLRSLAEGMAFMAGADWSEAAVGTNAPGTALALGVPVQIFGAEHLSRPVTPWSCSAAPIHDPDTGALLGVLDVTGGDEVVSPQSLSLVRATVAAVESELRLDRIRTAARWAVRPSRNETPTGRELPDQDGALRLEVLGAHGGLIGHGRGGRRLGLRHSEMLLLLSRAPDGLTASELALALSERDGSPVTVRAEMARLRATLPSVSLLSRPYRLNEPVRTDVDEVGEALDAGAYRRAVAAYRGPVLPTSEAPAVVELRNDLHGRLRSGLLRCPDPDAVLRFADTAHGRDDVPLWMHALRSLLVDSPRRPQVADHLGRLRASLR